MKLTYLGTAAAEGFPAVFCNCEYCRSAALLGGKNIRTRSQALVNEDLLLDLPADTYSHFLNNQIRGDKIQHLFVTHSHSDHFYPKELSMRKPPFAHDMDRQRLQVFGNEKCCREASAAAEKGDAVDLHEMLPFETVSAGDYQVTALPARHAEGGEKALFYIIQGDKTLLYAHDTGYFYEEVFEFIQEKQFRFDLISMDCTNVEIPIADTGSHMGIPNIDRVVQRLEQIGAVDQNTVKIINHFSHNGNPLQHVLEKKVAPYGYLVAYDGMQIVF